MNYQIEFTKQASKQLLGLPFNDQERIGAKIDNLIFNPRLSNATKLVGEEDLYRIRVGDYRIIYSIQDQKLLILIVKIGHRKNVYS
jgi:mRNA interferase RelE/StbE